ncbi:MAG: type II toxin-antitoxin system MqsA family antitoxin [Rhodocyclales bacterium]|nr:type II toxin-antitoxin system MqsA family antitoxin [Rhodocyclales bacterium]
MPRECLNCGRGILRHAVKDVPYAYKGHASEVPKIAGWHCPHCREVEFDSGEGERFADAIERIAAEIDAKESAELARIRKKLKLRKR